MITVTIFINNVPIITRGARNIMKVDKNGKTLYKCDDGRELRHLREDGAVKLAIEMLKGVRQL